MPSASADWQAQHQEQEATDPAAAARYHAGVRRNFDLVHSVAEALGGIPAMVSGEGDGEHGGGSPRWAVGLWQFNHSCLLESSKFPYAATCPLLLPLPLCAAAHIQELGPDEKAVVLFAAFLCQRLMEVSREERAAMVMQRLWRRRELHKPGAPEHDRRVPAIVGGCDAQRTSLLAC